MFFPDTGIPILNRARSKVRLEVWLPEPFTVPTVMEKLLTIMDDQTISHNPIPGGNWIMNDQDNKSVVTAVINATAFRIALSSISNLG